MATRAQWQAIQDATLTMMAIAGEALPRFALVWIDVRNPEPGFPVERARAMTTYAGRTPIVCVRLDQTPAELRKTMIHELVHCLDRDGILSGSMPKATYEGRAERVAAWLSS
jgi:hypothetical protein